VDSSRKRRHRRDGDRYGDSSEAKAQVSRYDPAAGPASEDDLHHLLDHQEFDGSFAVSDGLAQFFGFDDKAGFEGLAPSGGGHGFEAGKVWATAFVVAFLEARMAALKDEWELVAAKARGWIAKRGVVNVDASVASAKEVVVARFGSEQ